MSTKEAWPELVGKVGTDAQAIIKQERPDVEVQVMNENAPCTMDYRTDRVRVFVNAENKVTHPPSTG